MIRLLAILALLITLSAPVWADDAAAPAAKPAADALDQPKMDDKALLAYATDAVTSVMTFDNLNFQSRFLEAAPHFTKSGWNSFSAQLKNSGVFDTVAKKHYALTAEAASPAVIKAQGAHDGVYHWTVDLQLNLHYKSMEDEEHDAAQKVHINLERVPASDNPQGVQIDEWEAQ
jgi:hypothetical protein